MSMHQPRRRTTITKHASSDDRSRLALLWRAFEEAEERIRELERESDHRPARSAPSETVEIHRDESVGVRGALARIEQEASKRHDSLLQAITQLESEVTKGSAENVGLKEQLVAAKRDLLAARLEIESARDSMKQEASDHLVREEMIKDSLAHASSEIVRLAGLHEEAKAARAQAEAAHMAARAELATLRHRAAQGLLPSRPSRLFPVEPTRTAQIPTVTSDEVQGLRAAGVNMTDALLYADLAHLAGLAGIGVARLWKLRALAEIMSLHGIGPDWAMRLYQTGVRSIEDIARLSGEQIHARIWSTYAREGMTHDARVLLERTLPGRCASVSMRAREAVLGA